MAPHFPNHCSSHLIFICSPNSPDSYLPPCWHLTQLIIPTINSTTYTFQCNHLGVLSACIYSIYFSYCSWNKHFFWLNISEKYLPHQLQKWSSLSLLSSSPPSLSLSSLSSSTTKTSDRKTVIASHTDYQFSDIWIKTWGTMSKQHKLERRDAVNMGIIHDSFVSIARTCNYTEYTIYVHGITVSISELTAQLSPTKGF